jgi:hypothetical protein
VFEDAKTFSFLGSAFEVLLLTNIYSYRYYLGVVFFMEIFYEDGCVESAAVS